MLPVCLVGKCGETLHYFMIVALPPGLSEFKKKVNEHGIFGLHMFSQ